MMPLRSGRMFVLLVLGLPTVALAAEPAVDPGFEVAAGWEPVTHARLDAEGVRVERFGPAEGTVYFTVLNEGVEPVAGNMRVNTAALGADGVAGATEQVSGAALPASTELPLELEPQGLAVIEIALRQ